MLHFHFVDVSVINYIPIKCVLAAGVSDEESVAELEDDDSSVVGKINSLRGSKGRLTERLMAQGLLTQSMIKQLKKEWNEVIAASSDNKFTGTTKS